MFTGIVHQQGRLVEDTKASGQGGARSVVEPSPELAARPRELAAALLG